MRDTHRQTTRSEVRVSFTRKRKCVQDLHFFRVGRRKVQKINIDINALLWYNNKVSYVFCGRREALSVFA